MNKEHTIQVRLTEGQYNDLVVLMSELGEDFNVSAFVRKIISREINDEFSRLSIIRSSKD